MMTMMMKLLRRKDRMRGKETHTGQDHSIHWPPLGTRLLARIVLDKIVRVNNTSELTNI